MKSARDLVVLTTAPAGLGHIRVMEALRQGLPSTVEVEMLGLSDPSMQALHRATSINPYVRTITEFIQNNPIAEGGFTRWYRHVLRQNPYELMKQLQTLVAYREETFSRLVVVCTHFGAAHQLAAMKQELATKLHIPIVLAVVVTDDTAQHLWAVAGADYLFVPSESTRAGLEVWFQEMSPSLCPKIVVIPYPLSPQLREPLPPEAFAARVRQTKQLWHDPFTIMVPVSGAAVQLAYYQQALEALGALTPLQVIVVARQSRATKSFLDWCALLPHIHVYADPDDHQVVRLYEMAYQKHVIACEMTKPSEQTFKVLLKPRQVGGVALLLSEPVGRQEEDNLLFLNRHRLIPDLRTQGSFEANPGEMQRQAKTWRALLLPPDGRMAGIEIFRALRSGLFTAMMDFERFMPGHAELSDGGVEKIWEVLL